MAKITGAEKHSRRLRTMRGPGMVRAVTAALYGGASDIAVDAALTVTAGATSGKDHVPSAPGSPPNADTHVLDRNIEAKVAGPLKAEASSEAPYAAAQEMGSEKLNLPERPYMRPAAKRQRPNVVRRVTNAANLVMRSVT